MFFSQQLVVALVLTRSFAMVPIANNEVMGPAEVREPATRSPSDDPRTIRVQISALGETRNLQLLPRDGDVFAADFQGFLADVDETGNSVLRQIPADEDIDSKLYTDSTGSASLYVERRNGQIILEGILDEETRIKNDIDRQGRSLDEPVNHVVYKRVANDQGKCEAVVPNITEPDNEEVLAETRALPALVQPEVLIVLDYKTSLYHKFNMNTIKRYIGIFFYSVNRRYADFSSPKISNVVTGIVLTKSESAQNFLVYAKKPTLNAEGTLWAFGRWMYNQRATIKDTYDIAIWMSAMNFADNVVGKAFVAGACTVYGNTNRNVALVSDPPGSYKGIHTETHEMAHLYGSAHDGERHDIPKGNPGALACPSSGGYIMSYQYGTKNKFYFSSCSKNQIRFTLNSAGASCLRTTPKASKAPPVAILPGTIQSLDDQCRVKHGSQYIFEESKLSTVCTMLWCVPKPPNGGHSSQGPALEGSRCGTNKICIKGVCVKK